jgi:hypothetical protein
LPEFHFGINELIICTGEGIMLSRSKFNNSSVNTDNGKLNPYSGAIIKLALRLQNDNQQDFYFQKVYFKTEKIYFLFKGNIVIIGVFGSDTSSLFIKSYLSHMYISFINFNGEAVNNLQKSFKIEVSLLLK